MDHPVVMETAVRAVTIKPAPKNLLLSQDKKKVHLLHKNLTLATVLIQ